MTRGGGRDWGDKDPRRRDLRFGWWEDVLQTQEALVLADSGYATGSEVAELEDRGLEVLVAVAGEDRRRTHDYRPETLAKPTQEPKAAWLRSMRAKLDSDAGRASYRLRTQTVEPVFGIVKEAMGFRRFFLRGLDKVEGEWALVTLACNCKRLNDMMRVCTGLPSAL